ncbi:ABC transporter substrate-binding protein [Polymorphum gilvum]|uniref:ABC transporter substrate-binding protein n=1 Tax=Polymorphum gilvum (strain LMG 25793 / CGMCC 1.9160 / SL003B-26A1) TaxID=991905 RepID=F2IVU6_POLGS|nr:ABC transporter substrate-binding protein [Polymorphum gilvum]ADZ69203.1 ABC transporter substrate-binding protein [Polymorphum gilvum SL003B-26A1]
MLNRRLTAAAALAAAIAAVPASAETLKYAYQGTLNQLDPYSLNETFTLSAVGNVYEGLTRRNENLEIEPSLAESWEIVEPNRWRFHLRQGVKFHNGNDFTAEDVVFSATRLRSEGSDLAKRLGTDVEVVAVDDHTVDFVLPGPNPILHHEWDTWYIMDKEWTEGNGAVRVTSASDTSSNFAAFNTNGTGPFKLVSHEPGVKTVFEKNPDWWDTTRHNIDRVEFTPIASDATRVAALLSGELDMVYPVPVQDIRRVEDNSGTRALTGPELRTIFLGLDQRRDELLYSDVKGRNPFKDVRVRKAFYQAIDIEAIKSRVMRNMAEPTALLIAPLLFERADEFQRFPYDPQASRALLAEAGYPDGFSVTMDCPNDRYVNDEAICQAVAAMLARVGVKVALNAQPKAQYFARILPSGGYDTSFYMLGWTPGSLDGWNVIDNLLTCRDDAGKGGAFNLGGYCNDKVDALAAEILSENDPARRDALIAEAFRITHEEIAHLPLHQQSLAWGVSDRLTVAQRADDQFLFRFVTKN